MTVFFLSLLKISVIVSIIIILVIIITPVAEKKYSNKWRYLLWIILSLMLIFPINISLDNAPVNIMPLKVQYSSQPVTKHESMNLQQTNSKYSLYKNAVLVPQKGNAFQRLNLMKIFVLIWIMGASIYLLKNILSYTVYKKRIIRWCYQSKNFREEVIFQDVRKSLKINKDMEFKVCSLINSPMLMGLIKPIILIPQKKFTERQLTYIFIHELTHYKRRDIGLKVILYFANAMHWFNPFVYLMRKMASADIEICCDSDVTKDYDFNSRKEYAKTIIDIMKEKMSSSVMLSTNFSVGKKSVKDRIIKLIQPKKHKKGIGILGIALCVVLLAQLLVSCAKDRDIDLSFLNIDNTLNVIALSFEGIQVETLEKGKLFIKPEANFIAEFNQKQWKELNVNHELEIFVPSITFNLLTDGNIHQLILDNNSNLARIQYGEDYRYYKIPEDICESIERYILKYGKELSLEEREFEGTSIIKFFSGRYTLAMSSIHGVPLEIDTDNIKSVNFTCNHGQLYQFDNGTFSNRGKNISKVGNKTVYWNPIEDDKVENIEKAIIEVNAVLKNGRKIFQQIEIELREGFYYMVPFGDEINQKKTDNIIEKLGYIKSFNKIDNNITFDEVEWITDDNVNRVEELGYDVEEDFPNGFLIHNGEEAFMEYKIYDGTKLRILEYIGSGNVIDANKENFISRIEQWQIFSGMLAKVFIKDGTVVEVIEQYTP